MAETSRTPLPTCPMGEACKGMMEKPSSGVALLLPGILFIALGVLIVIEPGVLVWVMATAFILLGLMMLMMVGFISKIRTRFQSTHREAS